MCQLGKLLLLSFQLDSVIGLAVNCIPPPLERDEEQASHVRLAVGAYWEMVS